MSIVIDWHNAFLFYVRFNNFVVDSKFMSLKYANVIPV